MRWPAAIPVAVPALGQVGYTSAKAGVAAMMLPMARDLGTRGIRAVAIVRNPMLNGSCIRLDAGVRFAPK